VVLNGHTDVEKPSVLMLLVPEMSSWSLMPCEVVAWAMWLNVVKRIQRHYWRKS